jgi:hypothetical protein
MSRGRHPGCAQAGRRMKTRGETHLLRGVDSPANRDKGAAAGVIPRVHSAALPTDATSVRSGSGVGCVAVAAAGTPRGIPRRLASATVELVTRPGIDGLMPATFSPARRHAEGIRTAGTSVAPLRERISAARPRRFSSEVHTARERRAFLAGADPGFGKHHERFLRHTGPGRLYAPSTEALVKRSTGKQPRDASRRGETFR